MHRHYLPTTLRRTLEKTIKQARIVAEEGAVDAIRRVGVAEPKPPVYLGETERNLRRRLRAHARALGDRFDRDTEILATRKLVESTAYAHWHRMLFARFLAERGLLRHPQHGIAVTLDDCRELAADEGLPDAWAAAERYAALMLPGVFRIDDPVLELDLDPGHNQALIRLVTDLDSDVFQAEDSLGWTYQFWRAAEKDAVNKSGVKIGADELPAVTQLFTEPYMVHFLLHNTLGAWWAGKVLAANPALAQSAADEDALREACSLPDYSFDMLRFVREGEDGPWRPAAGTFPGWPKEAKAITMLDPCCGSGHFLTEALAILAALREVEEHLSSADAVAAVLRDNLHGLEIDGRCVQIAAFAVALSSWRIGGWQMLPMPHIAWVGATPPLPKREFTALANGESELAHALSALHDLFSDAPVLGSLLKPTGGDLVDPIRIARLEQLIEPLLERTRSVEFDRFEGVISARGMADAVAMLGSRYVLLATNVPFLGRGKQTTKLSSHLADYFSAAKADLSTAVIARMTGMTTRGGSVAVVSPQNWWSLGIYRKFRERLLSQFRFKFIAGLGSDCFQTPMYFFNIGLTLLADETAHDPGKVAGLDVSSDSSIDHKFRGLREKLVTEFGQDALVRNPDSRITVIDVDSSELLAEHANIYKGIATGDLERFIMRFWEINSRGRVWEFLQETPAKTQSVSAMSGMVRWSEGAGELYSFVSERLGEGGVGAWLRGEPAWGRTGVAIAQTGRLSASLYFGNLFDESTGALVPKKISNLPAIWAFVSSEYYYSHVRNVDQSLKVPTQTLMKVPFDLAHWQAVATEQYPSGMPEPYSDDPTQWVFHGHPSNSLPGTGLQVALARLCGYRWPAETDPDLHLSQEARVWVAKAAALPRGENDGLLGVPPVAGEKPLADRLRDYLEAAFGADWSDALERRLVAEADEALDKKAARDGSLEAWVRDRAFRQHCALFGQRPFLWHISDGLKDGFSVFLNYHRFDQANLRKLTYTLLGDWLRRAKDDNNALRYEKGRELQQMLEKILEGEKPYDIFVRWKPLAQQPLGWDPDLDDGVRQSIRPFIKAGVLTHDLSKILKDKDRGRDVPSAPWYDVFKGERRNDHHTTLAEKRAAREAAMKRVEAAK